MIRKIKIIVLCLVVLVSVVGCKKKKKKEHKVSAIPVEVGRVVRRDLKEYLRFTGDIEGEVQVNVFSQVPDRIRAIKVEMGQWVRKGQVLAIIEHTRLKQVQAQAKAQLAAVRSQLAGAKVSVAGAKLAVASARREYLRLKRLLRSGAVGRQQVDMAKTQYDGAVTKLQAAKTQILALRAQIQALRAAVAQASTVKRNAIIRAPISGIIARRYREVGDMASPQFPLFQIVRMDKVKVKVQITESDFSKVQVGKKAEITVKAYPRRVFVGYVTKVAPTLDLDTRTAPVEIIIPNVKEITPRKKCRQASDCFAVGGNACRKRRCVRQHDLKPGMIAQVKIFVRTYPNTLMIPLSAILNSSFGYRAVKQRNDLEVLTLDKNNKPSRRKIRIGLAGANNMVQVLSGLKEGERIVTVGHNLYKDGIPIRIVREETLKKL